jgi:hypothetical protein
MNKLEPHVSAATTKCTSSPAAAAALQPCNTAATDLNPTNHMMQREIAYTCSAGTHHVLRSLSKRACKQTHGRAQQASIHRCRCLLCFHIFLCHKQRKQLDIVQLATNDNSSFDGPAHYAACRCMSVHICPLRSANGLMLLLSYSRCCTCTLYTGAAVDVTRGAHSCMHPTTRLTCRSSSRLAPAAGPPPPAASAMAATGWGAAGAACATGISGADTNCRGWGWWGWRRQGMHCSSEYGTDQW